MNNSKKDKIINDVVKIYPSMSYNEKNNFNGSGVFQSGFYSDLRVRKPVAGSGWLPNSQQSSAAANPKICLTCSDYTERTTLHGLRYVGDAGLHFTESRFGLFQHGEKFHCVIKFLQQIRLFWTIAFLLGIMGAAYYISFLYTRWKDTPMIVSLSPQPTLLESIPFPAITICNMNGAKKSLAEPIMQSTETSQRALLRKKIVNDLCAGPKEKSPKVKGNWTAVQKILIEVSQPCHEMLVSCRWKSNFIPCNDVFNPELTDEGMCCSFNKVNRSFIYRNPRETIGLMNYTFPYPGIDWTPESGYPAGTSVDTNPWRAWGVGRSNGLTLVLDAQVNEYFCSSTASVGFKTMLHNPVEVPKISDMAYFLTPGVETRVEIQPRIQKSTATLVNIPLEKRLCFFQDERFLRFYRTYTQRNCQLECQTNFTLNQCNCVPFFLPKDVNTRICGTADEDCVERAREEMDEEQLLKLVNVTSEEPSTLQCSCLPSCDTIEYAKLMSGSKLEDGFAIKSDYLMDRDAVYYKENMAIVHFFFVDNTFIGVEKGEIFGFTEFLSSTGGLLGLFLGFSIMSAAEIFYFASLRLLCSWYRRRKRRLKPQNRPFPFTE